MRCFFLGSHTLPLADHRPLDDSMTAPAPNGLNLNLPSAPKRARLSFIESLPLLLPSSLPSGPVSPPVHVPAHAGTEEQCPVCHESLTALWTEHEYATATDTPSNPLDNKGVSGCDSRSKATDEAASGGRSPLRSPSLQVVRATMAIRREQPPSSFADLIFRQHNTCRSYRCLVFANADALPASCRAQCDPEPQSTLGLEGFDEVEIPGLGRFVGTSPNLNQDVLDMFRQMDAQNAYECVSVLNPVRA
jgi:hypothetical protein